MAKETNFLTDEISKLQTNNRLLAKAVADEKEKSKLYFNDKVRTQKQYMNLRKAHGVLNSRFQKAIKLFEDTANYISKVYEEIEKLQNIDINESSVDMSTLSIPRLTSISSPSVVPSCRVVAPMVSGYTIQRPFINLQRISIINRTQNKKQTGNEASENDIATTINISEQQERTIDMSNNNINMRRENVEVYEPKLYLEEETAINQSLQEPEWNSVDNSIDLELSEANITPLSDLVLEPLLEKRESGGGDGEGNSVTGNKFSSSPRKTEENTTTTISTSPNTSYNIYGTVTKRKKEPQPTYDPLEGPSSLLDKITKKLNKEMKMQASKNKTEDVCKESDDGGNNSDVDDDLPLLKRKSRKTSKRKLEESSTSSSLSLQRKKMQQCQVELEDIRHIKKKKKNNIKPYKSKTKEVKNKEEEVEVEKQNVSDNIVSDDVITTECKNTNKPQSTKRQSSQAENSIIQPSRISQRIKEKSVSPKKTNKSINNKSPSSPNKKSEEKSTRKSTKKNLSAGTSRKKSGKKKDSFDGPKIKSPRVNTRHKVKSYAEPKLNKKLRRSK